MQVGKSRGFPSGSPQKQANAREEAGGVCSGHCGVEKWRLGTSCTADPKGPSLSSCRAWGLEGGETGKDGEREGGGEERRGAREGRRLGPLLL